MFVSSDVNKATHVTAKATTPKAKAKAMAFKAKAKAKAAASKAKAGNLWPQAKAEAKAKASHHCLFPLYHLKGFTCESEFCMCMSHIS